MDITAAAAAMLGMPAQEMVGQCVKELSRPDPGGRVTDRRAFPERGCAQGETAWAVPSIGVVILRYAARRDAPIPGRHAVLVRRRQDAMPTEDDFDAAIADAFSRS